MEACRRIGTYHSRYLDASIYGGMIQRPDDTRLKTDSATQGDLGQLGDNVGGQAREDASGIKARRTHLHVQCRLIKVQYAAGDIQIISPPDKMQAIGESPLRRGCDRAGDTYRVRAQGC